MTKLIFVVLLMSMSFPGIVSAENGKVFVDGIGEVSESVARLILASKAINEKNGLKFRGVSAEKETVVSPKVETLKTEAPKKIDEIVITKVANNASAVSQSQQAGLVVKKPAIRGPFTDIREADHEVYGYAGFGYATQSHTRSGWAMARNTKWWGLKHYPLNLGGGLSIDSSFGKTGSGYSWGYIEPGVNLGAYAFDEANSNDILLRLNLAYRVPLSSNNTEGFVPGAELQVSHTFSNRLSLIAQVQGKYFRHDSHGGAALVLEYLVTPEFRLKGGIVADLGIGENSTTFGVGPTLSAEIDNRWVLGMNLLFFPSPNGVTIGPFVGLKYTKYLKDFDAQKRDSSVAKVADGKVSNSLPEISDVTMRDDGKGSFVTLPWASQETQASSDLTLAQTIQQKRGGSKP